MKIYMQFYKTRKNKPLWNKNNVAQMLTTNLLNNNQFLRIIRFDSFQCSVLDLTNFSPNVLLRLIRISRFVEIFLLLR